jgi:hypothetical protein
MARGPFLLEHYVRPLAVELAEQIDRDTLAIKASIPTQETSMTNYPKWLYHATKPAVIVPDEAAHKELGVGWYASPADFPKAAEPKKSLGSLLEETREEQAPEKPTKKTK